MSNVPGCSSKESHSDNNTRAFHSDSCKAEGRRHIFWVIAGKITDFHSHARNARISILETLKSPNWPRSVGNSKRCCKLRSHIVNTANQNAKPKTKSRSSAPTRFVVSEVATLLFAIAKQQYFRNFCRMLLKRIKKGVDKKL